MAAIVSAIGDIFAAAMIWLKTIAAVVAGGTVGSGESAVTYAAQPILLIGIVIAFVGLGIGMFKRLLN